MRQIRIQRQPRARRPREEVTVATAKPRRRDTAAADLLGRIDKLLAAR
ncbi:MAG: hypothetical protein ABR520_03735 [Mycobacteriales bacterium]|nr:hypothetical protein [Frankia sp.]